MNPAPMNLVFVCQKNGGKSQMAAALMRAITDGGFSVSSAGTKPGTALNPMAVDSLAEIAVTLNGEHPKLLTPGMLESADLVIVLGTEAHVPATPNSRVETWIIDEPSERGIEGMDRMRLVRDDIRARVESLHAHLSPR